MITILDGPLGTELNRRGVGTKLPMWSAGAIKSAPEIIHAIHADYARAGATVHTANTFRTKARNVGNSWEGLARQAVRLARAQDATAECQGAIEADLVHKATAIHFSDILKIAGAAIKIYTSIYTG